MEAVAARVAGGYLAESQLLGVAASVAQRLPPRGCRDARDEHASVAAFSRISLTLVALGAPSRLVELAHQAALQEIRHARRTFALASAYLERTVGPGPLPELLTEASGCDGTPAEAISWLAAESLADGCLGEGFAAAMAQQACTRARDPAVRETLAVIARDEAAHAEFSWELLGWCLAVGGEKVRDELRANRVFQETRDATVARASLLLNQGALGTNIPYPATCSANAFWPAIGPFICRGLKAVARVCDVFDVNVSKHII